MKLLTIIFMIILAASCSRNEAENKDVLDYQTMAAILADIHFAEAKVQLDALQEPKADEILKNYYDDIFTIHSISREVFLKSYDYYIKHPEMMDEIYLLVLEMMSEMEAAMKAKNFTEE